MLFLAHLEKSSFKCLALHRREKVTFLFITKFEQVWSYPVLGMIFLSLIIHLPPGKRNESTYRNLSKMYFLCFYAPTPDTFLRMNAISH